MATNKGQYLGGTYLSDCKVETREIELASEAWKILDELSKGCVSVNHRDPQSYVTWVLEHYIYLCKKLDGFDKGILPDGIDHSEEDHGAAYMITMVLKPNAVRSVDESTDGSTPQIASVEIKKRE